MTTNFCEYAALPIFQPSGNLTRGIPPAPDGSCPLCGSATDSGFGCAYGGLGGYDYCLDEKEQNCPWFFKTHYLREKLEELENAAQ